eukprot:jgi/Pico_ML_1/55305/g1006.t1
MEPGRSPDDEPGASIREGDVWGVVGSREAGAVDAMLFYSFFKSLVGKEVTVELKNDLAIVGTLHSIDQFLNLKLDDVRVADEQKHPHMLSVKNLSSADPWCVTCSFLRGRGVDEEALHDATRREARGR